MQYCFAVVISGNRREVVDMTSMDSRLFVVRRPSQRQIEIYDKKTFKQLGALQVKDLSDDTYWSGLAACVTYNCVYVSDSDNYKDTVYKIELSGNNEVFSWRVGRSPCGLSLNTACNLLVACFKANMIQEYTTSGSLVREIHLKSNYVELRPWHAIQVTSDQFVVSCCNETKIEHDVIEVDITGRFVVSYKNQLQSTTQLELNFPCRLALDKSNECIIVADYYHDRIVIFNRSKNCCARELNVMSASCGLQGPYCLHLDTPQNRLFVGEWRGQRRVFKFDSII
jgi:hypothetical protein